MSTAHILVHIPAIYLPPPLDIATPSLHETLKRRATTRRMAPTTLAPQTLANLLWSAFGINRDNGPFNVPGRTAGSASNSQEIDLYILMESGAYLYETAQARLNPVRSGDLRRLALTPGQSEAIRPAPVQLVYVADLDRLINAPGFQEPGLHDADSQKAYYYVDTGLIAQNVYLFAAATGLAAWFHNCDRPALTDALTLKPSQRTLFAQSVGYPEHTYET